jgi:hypothetical protein
VGRLAQLWGSVDFAQHNITARIDFLEAYTYLGCGMTEILG